MNQGAKDCDVRTAGRRLAAVVLMGMAMAWSVAAEPPTFHRDIAPIIFANCSECHRPNHVAPFSLLTYDDVRKRGRQVVEVTQNRYMPPWLPQRGGETVSFHGERGLSDSQIALIRRWMAEGAVEGDPDDLPIPPAFKDGWALGEPDLVLTLREPYTLPAQTNDTIRTFVLPVALEAERWVRAIDFDPGQRRTVHHASFLVDLTGAAAQMDAADPKPGYPSMGDVGLNLAGSFGTWSPGSGPLQFSNGAGRRLQKECDLSVELHFNATGKPEVIQPRIAIYFAPAPLMHEVASVSLGSFFIDIAPGEKNYVVKDRFTLPVDAKLLSVGPHAHFLCRRIKVQATLPDETRRSLLLINDWDFNWQQEFQYVNPINLTAGTVIEAEFVYDNSAENPRNPSSPPRHVRAGATALDEMALVFLNLIAADEQERPQLEKAHRDKLMERMREAQKKRAP